MLYLLLKVASAVGMGLVLKHAEARSLDRLPLIRTNYAVAAIIGFFAAFALGQTSISTTALLLAAGTGVLFVAGLLIWASAIRTAGLALSVVAMRSAVVIPLLAAAVIWREQPSYLEMIGSAVALLALALVLSEVAGRRLQVADETTAETAGRQGEDVPAKTGDSPSERLRPTCPGHRRNERRGTVPVFASAIFWLVLLFLADGVVMVPALVFQKEMPTAETMPFQTVIFVTAFLVTTLLYYLRRPRLTPQTLKWGALLGTANLGNYLFLVLALAVLPGLVVYPAIAAGEVGLMAVAGVVLWKEKVGFRSWLGIALAVLSLVLIQLGKAGA